MSASAAQKEHAVERASRIYEVVRDAAARGEKCPSNKVLAERFGCGTSRIAVALHFLEKCGMIIVTRSNATRVVEIRATGKQTSGPVGRSHWTERKAK